MIENRSEQQTSDDSASKVRGWTQRRWQFMVRLALQLSAPVIALIALIFWIISAPWFAYPLVIVPAVVAWVYLKQLLDQAPEHLLDLLGARSPNGSECERVSNQIERLSLAAGVTPPECLVLDDDCVNGLCLAGSDRSYLVVTTGVLQNLGLPEVEGLVAHLISRLASGDGHHRTDASRLWGGIVASDSSITRRVGEWGIRYLVEPGRELVADRDAVQMTRYPTGLQSALMKADQIGFVPTVAGPGTDFLWVIPPSTKASVKTIEMIQASVALRVDALAEQI